MGAVGGHQPFIEIPVVGIAGTERTLALRRRLPDVLRERVRGEHGEAAREPSVGGQLQGMVCGVADSGLIFNGAEVLVDAPGLSVSRGRPGTINGWVDVVRAEQPRTLGTHICGRNHGLKRQLLLDVEVPLLSVRGAEVGIERSRRGRPDELERLLLFGRRRRTKGYGLLPWNGSASGTSNTVVSRT